MSHSHPIIYPFIRYTPSTPQFNMAEKDISDLIDGLSLSSAQQQNADNTPTGGYNTDERRPHTRRRRHLPRRQKVDDERKPPNQNQKPNRRTRKDEQAPKTYNNAKTPGQPSLPKAKERRASIDESSAADGSSPKAWPSHVYIVQVMRPSEYIEGVYLSVANANNRALDYLEAKHSIRANEVSEERGLFGQATSAVRATKRMWPHTGTLEILTRGGTPWIKVLKKPSHFRQATIENEPAYLSLDRSDGIFVIGVYQSQDEAWEDCKKYWSDLSVCASMLDLKDWHDVDTHHAKAIIAGKLHRWSLKHCKLM